MPSTVNGIGTHYYGHRNATVRNGHCRNCGAYGQLSSYDTRLWVVVLFIPVIPLGRKRIIDDCPYCRRHYAANADEFAMASQLTISEALEKFRSKPEFDSALEAHAKMLGFHQHQEADALRAEALTHFPEDAKLRTAFASHLDEVGRYPDAASLYEEAFKIDTQLPEARIGVAYIAMNNGEIDDARKLLDFMESPGAGQVYPLGALETLATLFQQKGRHEEALQIFRHLLTEFPDAAQHHELRKMIRVSEKKVGTQESLLPAKEGSWLQVFNPKSPLYSKTQRRLAYGTLIVLLVVMGLAAHNEYIRTHRTLHVLNGLSAPAKVQVDDMPPVTVKDHERITLTEGAHKIVVTEPIHAEYSLPMNASYFDRFFKNPAWLVNVAGTAPLLKMDVKYAQNRPPPNVTVLAGKTTVDYPDIDYIFEKTPDSLEGKSTNETIIKTSLSLTPVEPLRLAMAIHNPAEAMTFLEAHLSLKRDDAPLMGVYNYIAQTSHSEKRLEQFLKAGLDERPLHINWHRLYQTLLEGTGRAPELVAVYDAAMQKEPDNGDLIYLRARIEADVDAKTKLVDRAREKSPRSYWPWNIVIYQSISRGDWTAAKAALQEATDRGMPADMVRSSSRLVRLALGEHKSLAKECFEELAKDPQDTAALMSLLDALADKPREARQEFQLWKSRLHPNSFSAERLELLNLSMLYMLGDLAGIEQALAKSQNESFNLIKMNLLLANGHPERITADPALVAIAAEPWTALSLSVAFHAAGKETEAAEWRQKAITKLDTAGVDEQVAGRMLAAKDPPAAEAVQKLSLQSEHKLVWLCAMSQKFNSLSKESGELARKLNVSHAPPYQLVQRIFPARGGAGR